MRADKSYTDLFLLAAVGAAVVVCAQALGGGTQAARALVAAGTLLANPVAAVTAADELLEQQLSPPAEEAPALPEDGAQQEPEQPADAQPEEPAAPTLLELVAQQYAQDIPAPENAGAVVEKTYALGTEEPFFRCGAGSIKNGSDYDTAALAENIALGMPFGIDPGSAEPQVLIYHTHATESYRMNTGAWYDPAEATRSTDENRNVCLVGSVMAQVLNDAGIVTLHDTTLHDYPDYNPAYDHSHATIESYLAQYPSIKVVLDVHRDAIEADGVRYAPVAQIGGRQSAQVMLICGANNNGNIPNCMENLRFAAAWDDRMESMYPGLTRSALFRYSYYNQDLSTGCLLIEVGGHGNTLDEAVYAGQLAGQALADLLLNG